VRARLFFARPFRLLSTSTFDGEGAMLYAKMFEQHMHPEGPWKKMLEATHAALPNGRGRVLDLATGPGEPANLIARELPNVTVVATDVAPDMIEKSKARMQGLTNTEFKICDMTDLSQFETGSFDVVTACYGYMFPEDKLKALQETRRVLKPGGTLIATYWLDVQFMKLVGGIMEAVLGAKPPPPPANPMSLAPPGLFDALLKDAGFTAPVTTTSEYPFNLGIDEEFQYKLATLLIKPKLDELDAHAVAREALLKKILELSYKEPGSDDLMVGPNVFALAIAKTPGA